MSGPDRSPFEPDIGVGLPERRALARFDHGHPPLVLVVGTGVDPVTSRFSGARSTN